MKTLYDLLGAHPNDDAEGLRDAFRKAAKANHPDLHAGDPDAAVRFREIVEAYEILRDAEQRTTYDRLLKFERERLRRKLRRTASDLMRNVVSDAVAVVGLAIVLGGGYTLFAYISKTHVEAGPAKIAAVKPAPRTDATRDKLGRTAAGTVTPFVLSAITSSENDDDAPAAAKGSPPLSSVGLNIDAAKRDDALDVPVQQADAKMSDDKHDMKLPDTRNVNAGNVKIPEMKIPARTRTAAKRQPASRTFAQASLESRSTSACSGSCSGDTPPLFGVGF
jgi:curved DNA-binding protein CbpA